MSYRDPEVDVQLSVRDIRRLRGMTQEAFASLLGVHPMTVSKWERGISRPTKAMQVVITAQDQGAGTTGV